MLKPSTHPVIQGPSTVPVLDRADVVVLGASFAGIAAALEWAHSGRRIIIVESRTYPGRELAATLRYWLSNTAGHALIEGILLQAGGAVGLDGSVPLHPDRFKRYLEDRLLDAGVDLLYASLPVRVIRNKGAVEGVVIANKSGLQAIEASVIIDATETAITAALEGVASPEAVDGEAFYTRTLEFEGVHQQALDGSLLEVPGRIGVYGNRVKVRQGYRGEGHVWVECCFRLPAKNSLTACGERERAARHRSIELASFLIAEVPPFHGSVLTSSSHELFGPGFADSSQVRCPSASEGADCCNGKPFSGIPHSWKPEAVNGIWLASPAWRPVSEPWWLSGEGAAAAGTRVGQAALELFASDGRESQADLMMNLDSFLAEGPTEEDGLVVRTLDVPQQGGNFTRRSIAPFLIPIVRQVDIVVAGGGTSGATAGITAAREGMRTLVLEGNPGLGGTGTLGGVDSYWFGRKLGFAAAITQSVEEIQALLQYKGGKWSIEAKMYALLREMERAHAEVWFQTVQFGVLMDGPQVKGAVAATRWGPVAIRLEVLLDATGDGDAAAFAGASFVYGAERDHTVMWYSLAQFEKPGRIKNNFTSMVDVSNIKDYTRAILAGRRRGNEPYEHGVYVATRESRHIRGDCIMKLSDQLLGRRWPDVINIHFSNHDIKGVSSADWVHVGCMPPNLEIELPYRMLLPHGVEGMLVIGKAISATHDALPAIRMQADLENLGGAAALAAAQSVRDGVSPRNADIRKLQRSLVEKGLLPPGTDNRKLAPIAYSDNELRALIASLDYLEGHKPLYHYGNMRMNEVFTDPIPFVEVCSVGPRIVPFLVEALQQAAGPRRVLLAQALAMLESAEAVPVLIREIDRLLDEQGEELPERQDDFMYVQLPPDHGAMPQAAYLLYALGLTADERSLPVWEKVVRRLHPQESDFKQMLAGLFYYVHAVCSGIERLADPRALPLLQQLHAHPALSDLACHRGAEPDYFLERRAMLELAIARAMARCGSRQGYELLIVYLRDVRALLAASALEELRSLSSGEDFGLDPALWREWLDLHASTLHPVPYRHRTDLEFASEQLLRRTVQAGDE